MAAVHAARRRGQVAAVARNGVAFDRTHHACGHAVQDFVGAIIHRKYLNPIRTRSGFAAESYLRGIRRGKQCSLALGLLSADYRRAHAAQTFRLRLNDSFWRRSG